MTLDLNDLVADWDCAGDEISARLVPGTDGNDVLQMRVDVGVLQMFLDGRPDGGRYRGSATVYEYIRELSQGRGEQTEDDWHELHRELNQFNYRRLALSSLIEDAFTGEHLDGVEVQLRRALRDIDHCLLILRLEKEQEGAWVDGHTVLVPTLIFNRARLLARLRSHEGRPDEAIDEIEAGARALEQALEQAGADKEQCAEDSGIAYLRQMAERLRRQHHLDRTLRERLNDAIEAEDFEAAARLRDELRKRGVRPERGLPAPESPDELPE